MLKLTLFHKTEGFSSLLPFLIYAEPRSAPQESNMFITIGTSILLALLLGRFLLHKGYQQELKQQKGGHHV